MFVPPAGQNESVCTLPRTFSQLYPQLTIDFMTEYFAAVGFPARVLGRVPLLVRFLSSAGRTPSPYGLARYGPSYRFRPWLRLDAVELENIEELINHGADAHLEAFRASHLAVSGSTAVVVSLAKVSGLWSSAIKLRCRAVSLSADLAPC